MELNEYQKQAMNLRMDSCDNDTYMLFGLMAEVGEIADKIAKWRRKGIARMDIDLMVFNTSNVQDVNEYKTELMKELGDCMWFIAGVADRLGFSLEDVCQMNLAKLKDRQRRDVIVGEGDNR